MKTLGKDEAVALFGSRVRGDSDAYSDVDLLVLRDHMVHRDRNRFTSLGFSVSAFTWAQFGRMAEEGSLFLQHLKQESIVLLDPTGKLTSTLADFMPCGDHKSKIEDNATLFAMTRGVPMDVAAVGWAYDVLAVAFRNHAVLLSAQEGVYLFSYPALVARVVEQFGLSERERHMLLSLRILKREYRSAGRVTSAGWSQLFETQLLLEKLFSVLCAGRPLSVQDFAQERLSEPANQQRWYFALRSYEGALRAISSGLAPANAHVLAKLEATIRDPSLYSLVEFGSLALVQTVVRRLASGISISMLKAG